jgi:hypothetical protein
MEFGVFDHRDRNALSLRESSEQRRKFAEACARRRLMPALGAVFA